VSSDERQAIVARWRAGACSAEIALMELLTSAEDVDVVEAEVADVPTLAALLAANRAGCARICAMLRSGVDPGGATAASVDEGIAAARALFDWSVAQDEATSVALYSLGNADILARATDEIVTQLDAWGVLARDARVLELGCGIGRFLPALAARTAGVVGIDVSPGMVAAARRRAPGVEVRLTHGRDLADLADASFGAVLAIDSFPYIVQAGAALVATLFAEARRVLAPGGYFVLLGYSYGGDDAHDRAEVARHAGAAGLAVVVAGERPFQLWNGLAFVVRRR
jgi:SAM-dependent methyltransferase